MPHFMKFFVLCLVLLSIIPVYESRYQFGIVKPKFTEGQCVSITFSDEFKTNSYNFEIIKVGKTTYLMDILQGNYDKKHTFASTRSAEFVDNNFKAIECALAGKE